MKVRSERSLKIRWIAWMTVVSFALTSVIGTPAATAATTAKAIQDSSESVPQNFSIPPQLGEVQTLFLEPTGTRPFIVLIQDAHAVLDAQYQIQNLIDYLQTHYGTNLIALEGGQGKADPTLLKAFPDETAKKNVLQSYLSRGEITATEMAAVFNPREGEYYGIEDWPLYEDNYFAYLKASEVKEKLLERIRELEKDFDGRRQKDYTPSLNRYHEQASDFWNDQADLSGLLQYFKEAGWVPDLQKDPSFSKSYPHLAALTEMEEQEKAQDRQDLEASIRRLGETFKQRYAQQLDPELQKWFNGQWQAYSAGLMSGAEFLRGVVDLGKAANLRPKLTPAMKKLLGHYQTLTAMKGSLLFDELAAFLDEIEKQLVQTPAQKELAGQYKRVRLIRNMARCELTRDELDQYEQDPEVYLSLLGNERENLGAAIEFYRLALERDEAFRRNIKSLLKARKRKLAVFVAGGFHTRGVERVMRAEGYSYAVIMPKIRGIEGGELYDGLMHGNLSYKKYLETSFYDAFMRHASLQLVADLKEEDFKRSLKLWRDDVIRRLAGEGRFAEAGDYTRYIDQLFELYRRKFGDGKQPQSR
ncbi:MAG: hypothetical protein PHS88_04330, partial [Candidatus Omnitrophica bacterium]|nr:hypothetical protein [Candidatus Omnitrophota bacterium]